MMRGTRTGCGGLRDGWARPAKRVPAQCSRPRPNHIVPSPPLSGAACCSGTNGGCRGVWASGDRQHTNLLGMPSAPNGTLPLIPHSPCPDRWASAGTLDSRQARQPLGWKGERVVCERRSGAESCTFCGPLDVDSVGSLAALILGVLLIWRSPAHRLRPLVIAHSSSPNLFPVSPPSRAPSRSRSCHRMRDSSLGESAFFPLWLARLQLGRLLSRLKVGTQGRVAARAARSPRCAVPAHRPAPSDVGSRSAALPCSLG